MHGVHQTDVSLLARFLENGDRAALETLVQRHWSVALQTARTVCRDDALAEEALQEAFLILLSARRRTPAFKFEGRFKAWFLTVVTNKARMALRGESRARRKSHLSLHELRERSPRFQVSENDTEVRTQIQEVLDELASLSFSGRNAVRQYFMNECSQQEMALRLGLSQQMVSRMITRGLSQLRKKLYCRQIG